MAYVFGLTTPGGRARPPQVRTSGEGSGGTSPCAPSPIGSEAAEIEVSFDLGAELLAQRAQELFAEMPFGSSSSARTGLSAAPSPLARSAGPSPR